MPRVEVAAQAAGNEEAAQEAAPGQPGVQLLRCLLQKLSLRLSDLERGRVAKMAEVVEVIVDTLHFRQQDAQRIRPDRDAAVGRPLDGFAIGERMRDRAHSGHALGGDRRTPRVRARKAALHASVLEEEPGLVMNDMFADVDKGELGGLEHIGPDRPERQLLDVDGVDVGKANATARGGDGVHQLLPAVFQDQRIGLGMIGENEPVQVHHFPLVPAKRGKNRRQARQLPGVLYDPHFEFALIRNRRDITHFHLALSRRPGVGEPNPAPLPQQRFGGRLKLVRRQRSRARSDHGVGPVAAEAPSDSAIV